MKTMSTKIELFIGSITVFATMITGDFIVDLFCGIFIYTASRLFYYYFNDGAVKMINSALKYFKNEHNKRGR